MRENCQTNEDIELLKTRLISKDQIQNNSYEQFSFLNLFFRNNVIDLHNQIVYGNSSSEKKAVKAINTVSADVSPNLKEIILPSAKQMPPQKTRNLRYFYHAAVGERNDLTCNLDISDGMRDRMTNSTSCTVRQIETTSNRPSIIWVCGI